MAKGDVVRFDAAHGFRLAGTVDVDGGTWKLAILSVGVDVITKAESNPRFGLGNLTEVTPGGNYAAGGVALTLDNSNAAGVYTQKLNTGVHSSGQLVIAQHASNPTNARTAVLYEDTAASDEATHFWDLTLDGGTTPVDMTAGPLTLDFITGPGEICVWPA